MSSQIIPLLFVPLYLEIMERTGKNYRKCEYLKNEKTFLNEVKDTFHSFEGLSFGEKKSFLIKISRDKL